MAKQQRSEFVFLTEASSQRFVNKGSKRSCKSLHCTFSHLPFLRHLAFHSCDLNLHPSDHISSN